MKFKKQNWKSVHESKAVCDDHGVAVSFVRNMQSPIDRPHWWLIGQNDESKVYGGPCNSQTEAIELAEKLIATGMI